MSNGDPNHDRHNGEDEADDDGCVGYFDLSCGHEKGERRGAEP